MALREDWVAAGQAIGAAGVRLSRLRRRLNDACLALEHASQLNQAGFVGDMAAEQVGGQPTLTALAGALDALDSEVALYQDDREVMTPLLAALILPEPEPEEE